MATKRVLKKVLLRACLHMQFPPFVWLFRFYYYLAIKVSVFLISRIKKASAIYISGSLGVGRAIYGLSDIDLNIVFTGVESSSITLQIRRLFRKLKILFPMLGSPEEKGIYFLDSFKNKYLRYPMIRHLFDPVFYPQKLVWGEDLLNRIVPEIQNPAIDQRTRLIWKLRYWLEKIVIFSASSHLTEIQLTHLYFKSFTNIFSLCEGLPFSDLNDGNRRLPIQQTLDCEGASTWNQLKIARDELYLIKGPSSECCFTLFKQVLKKCLEVENRNTSEDSGQAIQFVMDARISENNKISAWVEEIHRICGEGAGIEIRPFSYVPVGILDSAYFGLPALLVRPSSPLNLKQIHELRALYRNKIIRKAILLIQESGHFLYAVHPDLMEHWIYEPYEGASLFSSWNLDVQPTQSIQGLLRRLVFQATEIRELLEEKKLERVNRHIAWTILFTGLQRMLLLNSIRTVFRLPADFLEGLITGSSEIRSVPEKKSGGTWSVSQESSFFKIGDRSTESIHLTCDPVSVCQNLQELAFIPDIILDELLTAAKSWPSGQEVQVRLKNGIRLLDQMTSVALGRESIDKLAEMEPEARLTISAVVVTRNRADYLKSCLEALHRQTLQPDEIVVVDNGSTDNTVDVVQSFSGNGLIRYFHEKQTGIAHARNVGLSVSKSEIIAFVDDDAVAESSWLAGIEAVFSENSDVGIVGGAIHTLKETGRDDWIYHYHRFSYSEAGTR